MTNNLFFEDRITHVREFETTLKSGVKINGLTVDYDCPIINGKRLVSVEYVTETEYVFSVNAKNGLSDDGWREEHISTNVLVNNSHTLTVKSYSFKYENGKTVTKYGNSFHDDFNLFKSGDFNEVGCNDDGYFVYKDDNGNTTIYNQELSETEHFVWDSNGKVVGYIKH